MRRSLVPLRPLLGVRVRSYCRSNRVRTTAFSPGSKNTVSIIFRADQFEPEHRGVGVIDDHERAVEIADADKAFFGLGAFADGRDHAGGLIPKHLAVDARDHQPLVFDDVERG